MMKKLLRVSVAAIISLVNWAYEIPCPIHHLPSTPAMPFHNHRRKPLPRPLENMMKKLFRVSVSAAISLWRALALMPQTIISTLRDNKRPLLLIGFISLILSLLPPTPPPEPAFVIAALIAAVIFARIAPFLQKTIKALRNALLLFIHRNILSLCLSAFILEVIYQLNLNPSHLANITTQVLGLLASLLLLWYLSSYESMKADKGAPHESHLPSYEPSKQKKEENPPPNTAPRVRVYITIEDGNRLLSYELENKKENRS